MSVDPPKAPEETVNLVTCHSGVNEKDISLHNKLENKLQNKIFLSWQKAK